MKLKIGKIPYANLFPIFYMLEKECDCSSYEFIEGVPSELNKMLRGGRIDISPSSSIEYIRNSFLYQIIEGHSISAKGPIGSIFLFTKKDIHRLNGSIVHVSSQSETSVALLDVILKKFYNVQCEMRVSQMPEDSGAEAFLLIGDDALKYKARGNSLLVYDLGEIWYEKTGLPFVFALWIVRTDIFHKQEVLNKFIRDLSKAKEVALKNLSAIAKCSPMKEFMSEEEIVSYWRLINYDLETEYKKGLKLFEKYLKDIDYVL